MKVAVIGGTGFVGSYLLDELLAHGHQADVLVRPGSEKKLERLDAVTLIPGDVKNPDAIARALEGCEAAIYNVGVLREFPGRGITFEELQYQGARRAVDAAQALGVRRFLLTSAYGVRPDGTPYQGTKYRAEQYLKTRGLAWTIFRPTTMFGDPHGKSEFCTLLRDQMIRLPVPVPLFYDGLLPIRPGRFLLAPIHVRDVARIYVRALSMPETEGQTYDLCGPAQLEWREVLAIIARACGRRKLSAPVPALPVRMAAALLDRFEFFPLSRDQLTMLLEGNACDSSQVFRQFGITPTEFDEAALAYLRAG